MLTYTRTPEQSLPPYNRDNQATWDILTTPYKVGEMKSPDDTYSRNIDTNHINGWYRYPAFTAIQDPAYTILFSAPSLNWMSAQITLRLKGVHPDGKDIVVPATTILSVADSWYQGTQLTIEMLQEMTVLHIVEQIKNDYEITQQNDKLSAWVMKYDMTTGMNKYDRGQIKLNERRPQHFYSWNY